MVFPSRIITFKSGKQVYGIDILWVREIIKNYDVATVDRAPDYICGLVNLRGQILTVFDLPERLQHPRSEEKKACVCIVLKTSNEFARIGLPPVDFEEAVNDLVGLEVNEIGDVIEVTPDDHNKAPSYNLHTPREFINSVIQSEEGLIVVLSPGALLAAQATKVHA